MFLSLNSVTLLVMALQIEGVNDLLGNDICKEAILLKAQIIQLKTFGVHC